MQIYRSDKLISEIEKQLGIKINAKNRSAMQKIIRTYFVNIHLEACDATIMSINKRTLVIPQFND